MKQIIVYAALVMIGILLDEMVRHSGLRMVTVKLRKGQSKREAVTEVVGNGAVEYLNKMKAVCKATGENFEMVVFSASSAMIGAIDEEMGECVHNAIEKKLREHEANS